VFKKLFLTVAFASMMLPLTAFAGVFDILIESEGQTYANDFTSVEDMIDNIDLDEIKSHISAYTDNSAAKISMNFRGVPITLSAAANSKTIKLDIPSINVTETFTGHTRDDAVDDLEDWFKDEGGSAIEKLMEELAAETPSDPIAGNPNSLMSKMVGADYDYAVSPEATIEVNTKNKAELNANMISVFAKYTNYKVDGVKSKEYSLPLAYTIRFNGSKNTLTVKVPVSMTDVEGSEAYNVGLGLALGYQIKDNWRVTPAVGYGIVGSIDLGSVGQIVNGSVTSAYTHKMEKFSVTLGNMAGYYQTIPFKYKDYSVSPDIQNTVLRNGLNFEIPTNKLAKGTSVELFVTDTRYFGSELFIEQYNEIGFSYGFAKNLVKANKSYMSKLRAGITYLTAKDTDAFTVNAGFAF